MQTQGLPMFKTKEEKPYCYLLDNKNSKIEKLKLIQKLFGTGRAIAILSHIQSFIQQLKADNNLSFEEKKILSEFTRNKKLKSELLSLLRLAGDIYLPLKIDVLSTLKHLELISAPLAATSMKQILKLQEPFTEARKNIYCSVADKITLAVEEVPNSGGKT